MKQYNFETDRNNMFETINKYFGGQNENTTLAR